MKGFSLKLHDVHCTSCIQKIETALLEHLSKDNFNIHFAERRVEISSSTKPETFIKVLANSGYEATLISQSEVDDLSDKLEMNQRFKQAFVAGIFGVLVMLLGMSNLVPPLSAFSGQLSWIVIGIVCLLVMSFAGKHFYFGAYKSLVNLHATMDTLIATGTSAAFIYSMFICIKPDLVPASSRHIYFEAALVIIALVNLGSGLEIHARGKTSQAIKRLIGLQAKTARRVTAQGEEEDIAISDVIVGDVIRVRSGEKIAVDGIIIEGHSTIDESMLTGESMPVAKNQGIEVFGGTINIGGTFLFRADKVGRDTVLSQIVDLVTKAQSSKPSIARFVDSVSAVFVPLVLLASLITGVIWYGLGAEPGFVLVCSMTVLVIACPCALGLAAPISIIVGMGRSAEHGILIKNAEALQKASQLQCIVLDKTGTITQGKPEVVNIFSFFGSNENEILQYAASLEQGSEHPLAQAVLNCAKQRSLELLTIDNFSNQVGYGIQATIKEKKVYLGNEKFLMSQGIELISAKNEVAKVSALGQTPLFLAFDNRLIGVIVVSDPIKQDSQQAIQQLQALGLDVWMITGDNQATALAIARQVGIKNVIASALPADKLQEIKRLQLQHHLVAMVGDGINDAPALTQADVGFAIGAGSDVAIESADVTLISNSIQSVIRAIIISKATMRNIKQNMMGAFIYNVIGIPIAAGVLYPIWSVLLNPMIAGAAMAASSVTVVMNANRLRLLDLKLQI